ncbi:arabinofuranosidase [Vararia minispora EC-137]|uniref:Arabinofuranosidase n=1 Tax=Vararia minispora EC-137 TaxID=1314806 RepID=A0ACB8QEW2_9AGAM|nr:arabinofuranosidase [Vararia minispora EC-137]
MFFIALAASLVALGGFPVASLNVSYKNPILPGFHPDPSCILVREWDDTFFCATSSFNAVPGVPVFASKDLQNFRQIGNVITRQSQLPGLATTNGSTSGIWAPTIRFQNGTFWVVTTLVYDHLPANDTARWDNIIFHSSDPYDSSSWSDPVHFAFEGYDTSPYWAANGTTYIVGSHAWKIEEMIMGFQLDFSTGELIGEINDMWPGLGGIAPEAPHLFSRDDAFYLMIAEGGTGLGHKVNFARAPSMWGPYEGAPNDPLLTAANTSNYFQTVGHADLFQDINGNWWAVALSTRGGSSYTYFPMGRETILTPAAWEEGQYPTFDVVEGIEHGPLPSVNKEINSTGYWVGTTTEHITFPIGSSLPSHFVHQRYPDPSAYIISPAGHPNTLALAPSVLNLTGPDNRTASTPQTFVGRRQEHIEFTYQVTLDFDATEDEAEAGITVFLNQNQHFDLGIVTLTPSSAFHASFDGYAHGTSRYVRLRTVSLGSTDFGAASPLSGPAIVPLHAAPGEKVTLQVEAVSHTRYEFRYATPGKAFESVGWGNSSEVSGGFVGTIVGVFATGNGRDLSTNALFSDWTYKGRPNVL